MHVKDAVLGESNKIKLLVYHCEKWARNLILKVNMNKFIMLMK